MSLMFILSLFQPPNILVCYRPTARTQFPEVTISAIANSIVLTVHAGVVTGLDLHQEVVIITQAAVRDQPANKPLEMICNDVIYMLDIQVESIKYQIYYLKYLKALFSL
jgi:hypothetical protein